MRIEDFGELKTGTLVPIETRGRTDYAFLPPPLPAPLENTPFWPQLLEARTSLARLDAMGSQLPDIRLLLRPLQRREALTSNSLEGTFVTPQELLLFEARKSAGTEQAGRDDWQEVLAYDHALRLGCQRILSGASIDSQLLLDLHAALMGASGRGRSKGPGEFRSAQVFVGADRRYIPAPPEELGRLLDNLAEYLASPPEHIDPLIAAFAGHYQFEAIHPFLDGNGRLGRLLLSLCAFKWLGLSTPCLYLSEFFERHRRDYMSHLFRISTHGEWNEWILFCLEGTVEQACASVARCESLQALRRHYRDLVGADSKAVLLLDDLFSSPFMTVREAQQRCNVSYRPAKSYLDRLVTAGILAEMTNQYPRTYVAKEIFDVAYGD